MPICSSVPAPASPCIWLQFECATRWQFIWLAILAAGSAWKVLVVSRLHECNAGSAPFRPFLPFLPFQPFRPFLPANQLVSLARRGDCITMTNPDRHDTWSLSSPRWRRSHLTSFDFLAVFSALFRLTWYNYDTSTATYWSAIAGEE